MAAWATFWAAAWRVLRDWARTRAAAFCFVGFGVIEKGWVGLARSLAQLPLCSPARWRRQREVEKTTRGLLSLSPRSGAFASIRHSQLRLTVCGRGAQERGAQEREEEEGGEPGHRRKEGGRMRSEGDLWCALDERKEEGIFGG